MAAHFPELLKSGLICQQQPPKTAGIQKQAAEIFLMYLGHI